MESLDMELLLADDPAVASGIVEKTIQNVYLHYRPSGAVQFFLDLHSETRIEEVMFSEEIYLAVVRGTIIGTRSIQKNEVCRSFILREYQKMKLMFPRSENAEKEICHQRKRKNLIGSCVSLRRVLEKRMDICGDQVKYVTERIDTRKKKLWGKRQR